MAVTKNIFDMDKVEILEELFEINVDLDDIHEVRDIYRLSNAFLCNMLDHIDIELDYMKCKFEFDNDDLRYSSDRKIEIIHLVTSAIHNDVCANELCVLKCFSLFLSTSNELQKEHHFGRVIHH